MKARTQINRIVESLNRRNVETVRTSCFASGAATDVPARKAGGTYREQSIESGSTSPLHRFTVSPFLPRRSRAKTGHRFTAFTLIELLVVIAVIAVLAALLIPAGASVVRKSNIKRAQAELGVLEMAIDGYHAKYGYYPPGNTNADIYITNQLYYELMGTTVSSSGGVTNFTTLDNSSTIAANNISTAFGVGAFMNCTRGNNEDSVPAKDFLSDLKPSEIASNGIWAMIVTSANSDAGYAPLPGVYSLAGRPANPWRYRYPGSNNPTSYDLWVQVDVGGKTNLICNWAKQPQYNVLIQGQ